MHIAVCAATVFARKGFGATSMGEIAEAAGVGESLLYHYFPQKSLILRTLADDYNIALEQLMRDVERAVRGAASCETFLMALGREYVQFILRTHHVYVLWMMDIEPFTAVSAGPRQAGMQIYTAFGARLDALPDFRNADLDGATALRMFLASLLTIVLFNVRGGFALPGNRHSYDALLRDAVTYALSGCLGNGS